MLLNELASKADEGKTTLVLIFFLNIVLHLQKVSILTLFHSIFRTNEKVKFMNKYTTYNTLCCAERQFIYQRKSTPVCTC